VKDLWLRKILLPSGVLDIDTIVLATYPGISIPARLSVTDNFASVWENRIKIRIQCNEMPMLMDGTKNLICNCNGKIHLNWSKIPALKTFCTGIHQ
jgi:hypothetical protein